MNKNIKHFFVSFAHSNGFGRIFLRIEGEFLILRDAEEHIKKVNSLENAVILYYKEVPEQEFVERDTKIGDNQG